MRTRASIVANLVLFGSVLLVACHRSAPVPARPPRAGFGEEWLSWTPQQRAEHTATFVDSASITSHKICDAIWYSIPNAPGGIRLPAGTLIPPDACLGIQKFSKQTFGHLADDGEIVDYGVSAYTTVIDDFYKHPECLVMPYDNVLEHLDDKEYMSGEDVFKLLQSGRKPWGSFSGFPGMDKCYR